MALWSGLFHTTREAEDLQNIYIYICVDGVLSKKNEKCVVGETVDFQETELPAASTCFARPTFPSRLVPLWRGGRVGVVAL